MEELAIVGIVLLGLIIMLLQHLFNWMIRDEGNYSTTKIGVLLTIVSYFLMVVLFFWTLNIWGGNQL